MLQVRILVKITLRDVMGVTGEGACKDDVEGCGVKFYGDCYNVEGFSHDRSSCNCVTAGSLNNEPQYDTRTGELDCKKFFFKGVKGYRCDR